MLKRKIFVKNINWILANVLDVIGNLIFFKHHTLSPRKPNRILILRTDGIGDTLLTTPLIKSLKKLYPETQIDCFIRPNSKGVLRDNLLISNFRVSDSLWNDLIYSIRLRVIKYDIVISPRPDGYILNHFMSFLIGSTRRVGFAMKGGGFILTDIVPWNGEKPYSLLINDIINTLVNRWNNPSLKFQSDNKLDICISKEDDEYVNTLLSHNLIASDDLIIGINPFASHRMVWPASKFISLVENLNKIYSAKIVFIGENKTKDKIEIIRNRISVPTFSFAGLTNIRQLAALIKRFKLLITNDSAPRHIANAVNTPVIVLRNLANSNVIWGKYCDNEHLIFKFVPCAPCGKTVCPEKRRICMTQITQEEVLTSVKRVIGKHHCQANVKFFNSH